jgi:hypothetical protein
LIDGRRKEKDDHKMNGMHTGSPRNPPDPSQSNGTIGLAVLSDMNHEIKPHQNWIPVSEFSAE